MALYLNGKASRESSREKILAEIPKGMKTNGKITRGNIKLQIRFGFGVDFTTI